MEIVYDSANSDKNMTERKLPFHRASEFDWSDAIFAEDNRSLYSEVRFVAVGYLEKRLHVICFTPITNGVRIISFRKANDREAKRYDKALTII